MHEQLNKESKVTRRSRKIVTFWSNVKVKTSNKKEKLTQQTKIIPTVMFKNFQFSS